MTSAADADATLWALEFAALSLSKAIQELENEICSASADGLSLRAIAAATGVSHEKVRQILKEAATMKTHRSHARYSSSGLPHVLSLRDATVSVIHQDGGEEMAGCVVDVSHTYDKNNGPILHIRECYGNSTDRTFKVRYRQIADLTVW